MQEAGKQKIYWSRNFIRQFIIISYQNNYKQDRKKNETVLKTLNFVWKEKGGIKSGSSNF